MSIDGTPLSQVKYEDRELIAKWEHENVTPNIRAFFKPIMHDAEYGGCDFYIADFVTASGDFDEVWDDPEVTVLPLCYGTIMWDGLRHIYFGEKGYVYYMRPKSMIKCMELLMRLEKRFCPEHGLDKDHDSV